MNVGKKRRKYLKIKQTVKIISIFLVLSLLMSNIFTVNALTQYEDDVTSVEGSEQFAFDDPLEFMEDIPAEWQGDIDEPELSEDIYSELELYEAESKPEPDNGATDKYIVKYKEGKKDDFNHKMKSKVANGKALGVHKDIADPSSINNKNNGNKNENANTNNGKGKGSGDSKKTTLETNDWEILTLTEKMLPSEFAAEIQAKQSLDDIEYIQPDYMLSLDSIILELDFSDENGGDETTDESPETALPGDDEGELPPDGPEGETPVDIEEIDDDIYKFYC